MMGNRLLKSFGVICIVFGCIGMGFYMAWWEKRRIRVLQELQQSVLVIYGEIEYEAGDMEEIMVKLGRRPSYLSEFYMQIAEEIRRKQGHLFYEIWRDHMHRIQKRRILREEDLIWIEEIGQSLGNLDRKTQLRLLQMYEKRLSEKILQARAEYENKAKVSRVVGITVGVFFGVLFI